MFTSGLSEGRVAAGRGKRSQGSESFNPASDDCGRSKHSLAVWNAPRLPAGPAASSGELVAAPPCTKAKRAGLPVGSPPESPARTNLALGSLLA